MSFVGIENMHKLNSQFEYSNLEDAKERAKELITQFQGTGSYQSITICEKIDNSAAKKKDWKQDAYIYKPICVIE